MSAEPVPRPSSDDERAEEVSGSIDELLSVPEFRAAVARLLTTPPADPGRRLRLVGRARKVSVSMPEDLTAAVQRRVGRGEFSQYVTEAVARQLELDLLGELSALLQEEHGPISDEALAEARRSWPDVR
jgi:Arc/MetJ-type ribon-helix-helix transcriptional regulator